MSHNLVTLWALSTPLDAHTQAPQQSENRPKTRTEIEFLFANGEPDSESSGIHTTVEELVLSITNGCFNNR